MGFVSRDEIPRMQKKNTFTSPLQSNTDNQVGHQFVGGVDMVFGEPGSTNSQEALSALARALEIENKAAIARYVYRANANPKLMRLFFVTPRVY